MKKVLSIFAISFLAFIFASCSLNLDDGSSPKSSKYDSSSINISSRDIDITEFDTQKSYKNTPFFFRAIGDATIRVVRGDKPDSDLPDLTYSRSASSLRYTKLDIGFADDPMSGSQIELSDDEYVYIKAGLINQQTCVNSDAIKFEIYGNVEVGGNIMSLYNPAFKILSNIPENDYFKGLFKDNTSIVSASALNLSAESLKRGCYKDMFKGCTALKYPPKLEATSLDESCCESMFEGCKSLKRAPELYATKLVKDCYKNMFKGCKSLSSISVFFTNWGNGIYTEGWVDGVSSTGKFSKLEALETEISENRIPKGWECQIMKPVATEAMPSGGWTDNIPTAEWDNEPKKMPLKITAKDGAVSITLVADKAKAGAILLCYTTDKVNWLPITLENKYFGGLVKPTQITIPSGESVWIKGYAKNNLASSYLRFKMYPADDSDSNKNARVSLAGNLMSLYVNRNFHTLKTADEECFRSLFSGCDVIDDASGLLLPASQLSELCYAYMFQNCSNLTKAPELTSTKLAKSCYAAMFSGCESLTNPSALPATSVDYTSYALMFENCTSLETAPALPATKLAPLCYSHMFDGCSNLINAPALPAKELYPACYSSMFAKCTSLETAPDLPAVNSGLSGYCYSNMFSGCTSLVNLPEFKSTDLSVYPKHPHLLDTEGPISCYDHMFDGCTSITTAPELPAVKLSPECYWAMFMDCENLTTAPVLPATNLSVGCYMDMFKGCTSLVTAPALPAKNLAHHCYHAMFYGCKNLINPPALPAKNLASSCYGEMFAQCDSLISAPELPATRLASYAYWHMFASCDKIKDIRVHFTNWSDATHDWLMWTESNGGILYCPSKLISRTSERNDSTAPLSWVMKDISNASSLEDDSENYDESLAGISDYSSIPLRITAISCETELTITKRAGAETLPELVWTSDINSPDWQDIVIEELEKDSTLITIPKHSSVFIKAKTTNQSINGSIMINTDAKINVSGALASLLTSNYNSQLSGDGLFESVFANSNVKDASNLVLPANISTESKNVFKGMFQSCLQLSTPPAIGYGSIGEGWFKDMFRDCVQLATAPALPATTIAAHCYESMFEGCKSLKLPPALPATSLADNCYERMFKDCYALSSPEGEWILKADILKMRVYCSMFENCISLTKTPKLEYTNTLRNDLPNNSQYAMSCMFKGCTKLVIANDLPSTRLLSLSICEEMFRGCKSLRKAPALPAIELAPRAYSYMFSDCTSLVEAPELPAKEFFTPTSETTNAGYGWSNCYNHMFNKCTQLKTAPKLPATLLAYNCYESMFRGCTSLIEAPELRATRLYQGCYINMFYGCTSLKRAPELAVESVDKDTMAYNGMFEGCTSLEYIKVGFKSWDNEDIAAGQQTATTAGFTVNWVRGVPEGGVFVCPKELKQIFCTGNTYTGLAKSWGLTTAKPHYIPAGWTVVTE